MGNNLQKIISLINQKEIQNKQEFQIHFNTTQFLVKIRPIIKNISNLSESQLKPGTLTNKLFSDLISLVTIPPIHLDGEIVLQNLSHILPQLRINCGIAEYYLEEHFTKQVLNGNASLNQFLYKRNYELLVKFELESLETYLGNQVFQSINKVSIIGSGPLPLTSIELVGNLNNVHVTNYDKNKNAIQLGFSLIEKVGLSKEIRFVLKDVLELEIMLDSDVVFLAALVGDNLQQKEEIVAKLYRIMKPGAVLMARSASGLKKIVYEEVDKSSLKMFNNVKTYDPKELTVINSVVIGMR